MRCLKPFGYIVGDVLFIPCRGFAYQLGSCLMEFFSNATELAVHGPRQYRFPRAGAVLVQGTLQNESCLWVAAAELFYEHTVLDPAAALTLREILQIQWKASLLCQGQAEER